VCGGFASAGDSGDFYEAALRGLLPRARVRVMTDAELAWRAAAGGGDGIVIIAGTGSIAWGGFAGKQARAGGLGPGQDPGSGDWLGREAVAAGIVAAPEEGQFPALLPRLLAEQRAAMQPILRRAAEELAATLSECAAKLGWSEPVGYYSGGVFAAVPELRGWVEQAWGNPLREPRQPAIAAALAMAREATR
jgi:N-acetylglucosamine kinase-like BadF-type ATPase